MKDEAISDFGMRISDFVFLNCKTAWQALSYVSKPNGNSINTKSEIRIPKSEIASLTFDLRSTSGVIATETAENLWGVERIAFHQHLNQPSN